MKNRQIQHLFYIQIQNEIDRVERKSDIYRIWYYGSRIFSILLAGAITVISGWQRGAGTEGFLNAILILGALSATLTATETLFQVETKRSAYRLMLADLREIRSEFVYFHDHAEAALEDRIKSHLFPKYQTTMACVKSLIDHKGKPNEEN